MGLDCLLFLCADMLLGTDELSELPLFYYSAFYGVSGHFSINLVAMVAVFEVESFTESFFCSYLLKI